METETAFVEYLCNILRIYSRAFSYQKLIRKKLILNFFIIGLSVRSVLGYFSGNLMFPIFLQLLEKQVLDPNGPYINTFQTILSNVCLPEISEFCLLWSVAYLQPKPAFVEA